MPWSPEIHHVESEIQSRNRWLTNWSFCLWARSSTPQHHGRTLEQRVKYHKSPCPHQQQSGYYWNSFSSFWWMFYGFRPVGGYQDIKEREYGTHQQHANVLFCSVFHQHGNLREIYTLVFVFLIISSCCQVAFCFLGWTNQCQGSSLSIFFKVLSRWVVVLDHWTLLGGNASATNLLANILFIFCNMMYVAQIKKSN